MTDELVYANGIDATTGGYLLPPLPPSGIAELARREEIDPRLLRALTKATAASDDHLGLPFDVDPANVAQAGWGVVFGADEDPQVKAALAPLLALRTSQVTDAAPRAGPGDGGRPPEGARLRRGRIASARARPPRRRRRERRPDVRAVLPP